MTIGLINGGVVWSNTTYRTRQLNTVQHTRNSKVAIVQISQITNRKGLQENLPQLAGAELGWSVDTRRLYIGNGTLQEGAPEIGNTEILTEFSEIIPPPNVVELLNNQSTPAVIFTQDLNTTKAFSFAYTITRDLTYRTGTVMVAAGSGAGALAYTDDYIDNADTGITLTVTQVDSTIRVNYTSTNTGDSGTMSYVITNLF